MPMGSVLWFWLGMASDLFWPRDEKALRLWSLSPKHVDHALKVSSARKKGHLEGPCRVRYLVEGNQEPQLSQVEGRWSYPRRNYVEPKSTHSSHLKQQNFEVYVIQWGSKTWNNCDLYTVSLTSIQTHQHPLRFLPAQLWFFSGLILLLVMHFMHFLFWSFGYSNSFQT